MASPPSHAPSDDEAPAADDPPTPAQQQQSFRLLDLPPELLLRILSLSVVQPTPICIHSPAAQSWQPPPITRANALLRQEGLKLFYARNVFHGVNWLSPRPRDWLKGVPEGWRGEMRGVVVSSGWGAEDVASHFRSAGITSVLSALSVLVFSLGCSC